LNVECSMSPSEFFDRELSFKLLLFNFDSIQAFSS
jgi:hypothetical protein